MYADFSIMLKIVLKVTQTGIGNVLKNSETITIGTIVQEQAENYFLFEHVDGVIKYFYILVQT